jgi:uncharacterized protein (TIGR01319 family)
MRIDVLVAEIGSTTTLVNAFNLSPPEFIGQGCAPTTVLAGDVRIGLQTAIEDLEKNLTQRRKGAKVQYTEMLATSSAAGGLKMTVHGLVYDMTVKAAREAALGAGAVIKKVSAGILTDTDLEEIKNINPNIIMLAGGVDHGEKATVIENAKKIANTGFAVPVIYAGNIDAQDMVAKIFCNHIRRGGFQTRPYPDIHITDNVYPKIDMLNVEPARKIIQEVFEEHIVHAPGMEHIREMVTGPIIPTPGAVMETAKCLYNALGDLIVLDVGGATTDFHSVTEGSEEIARILIAPEPVAKRTVEGDLGVYVNRFNVAELLTRRRGDAELLLENLAPIPRTAEEVELVEELTQCAVTTAFERHAGHIRYVYGPEGRSSVAEGKDLTRVKYIVGTGGALTRLPHRVDIMKSICKKELRQKFLSPPADAQVLVDNDYIFASLGVLSKRYPEAAVELMKKSINHE